MVLDARRGFDAGAGVDPPGVSERDGVGDIGSIESAGDNDASGGARRQMPIEGLARAAVEIGGGSIEEQGLRGDVLVGLESETGSDPGGLPHGKRSGVMGGGFIAVKL